MSGILHIAGGGKRAPRNDYSAYLLAVQLVPVVLTFLLVRRYLWHTCYKSEGNTPT